MFFFFKQKTAYEMRISDWSSDVCSSDLHDGNHGGRKAYPIRGNNADIQTHYDSDEQYAQRQALEWGRDNFDLPMIFGFGDQQSCEQRPVHRGQASYGSGEAEIGRAHV